jgi:hypothetical protein
MKSCESESHAFFQKVYKIRQAKNYAGSMAFYNTVAAATHLQGFFAM